MLMAGCTSGGSATSAKSGTGPTGQGFFDFTAHHQVTLDTARNVAAGVVRVSFDGSDQADLRFTQMTSMDVLLGPLSRCAKTTVGRDPLYFDLNWQGVVNEKPLPSVHVTATTPSGAPLTVIGIYGRCHALSNYPLGAMSADNEEQRVLQLVAPRAHAPLHSLNVTVAGLSTTLPIDPYCHGRNSSVAKHCPPDFVTYQAGTSYSVSLPSS